MGLVILLGLFALCVVAGIPVAFALGIAGLAAIWYEGLPLLIGFQRIISGVSVFSLMAIAVIGFMVFFAIGYILATDVFLRPIVFITSI